MKLHVNSGSKERLAGSCWEGEAGQGPGGALGDTAER